MRIKFRGKGLKIAIDGVDVNVFDANGRIRPNVKEELTLAHIDNTKFSLFKINKYDKALRNDYNNEYYFDKNHLVVWGKDRPVAYAYAYVIRVRIKFKDRDMVYTHTYNSNIKYNNLKDAELENLAFEDLLSNLRKDTKENKIIIEDISYRGGIPINRWGKSIRVNGSLLVPDLNFIDKTDDYTLEEDRCFYDLIMIECGIFNKRPKTIAMGDDLYNKFFIVDNSYARPRKTLNPKRYELLWEDLWGIPFKDAKKDNPTNKDLWAVNLEQIDHFVRKHKFSIYLCDVKSNIIYHNVCKRNGICLYALLDNGHLTIIPKEHTKKRRSLSQKALDKVIDKIKEEQKEIEINNKIVWCKDNNEIYIKLKEHIDEYKTYPIKNIRCNHNGLFSFSGFTITLADDQYLHYIIENKRNLADYDYYGKNYYGQSLVSEVVKVFDDTTENHLPISKMSKTLFDIFSNKDQKYKMARGWRNEEVFYGELNTIDTIIYEADYRLLDDPIIDRKRCGWKTFDICKCYRYVIENMTYYYQLGFNSVPIKFKGKDIQKGFYYINTDYNLLFSGSKWYSDEIVLKGLKEGIICYKCIEYFIKPKRVYKGDYFNILIDKFKDNFKYTKSDDEATKKRLKNAQKRAINCIAGLTQRHSRVKQKTHKFTDKADEVGGFISNNRDYSRWDKVAGLFLYGSKEEYNMYSNHLPIANQLLDKASILLYDKLKLLTNIEYPIVYYNTDSITIHKTQLKKDYRKHIKNNSNKRYGDLVEEIKTHLLQVEYGVNVYKPYKPFDLTTIKDFGVSDSTDWEEYCELIDNNKSIMTLGDAGTGKSHIIKQLDKEFKLCKVAFTNKATNKIGGKTYHREFVVGKVKQITKDMIDGMRLKKYDAIIAEEISMNGGWIWRLLEIMKAELNIPILAFGDWKQIPPVKDDNDYKNHLIVNSIFDYKTKLTKNHRADLKLVGLFNKYATNMRNFPLEELPLKEKLRYKNICWTNNMRKWVNSCCAKKFNKDKKSYISYTTTEKDEKDNDYDDDPYNEDKNPTQNISVSVGMPMICRKTKEKDGLLQYYNNEEWKITNIYKGVIPLEQQIKSKYSVDELMTALKTKDKQSTDKLVAEFIKTKKPKHDKTERYRISLKSKEREDVAELDIPLDDLQKYFLVAFCITTHKAQGDTIDEEYNIYEWDRMDNALKYTALSRTKSHKKVCVIR